MVSGRGIEHLLAPRADWMSSAACKGQDVDIFFVDPGKDTLDAVAFCARCDVRKECLRFALDNSITVGIWGGLSPRSRRDPARRDADVKIPTRDRIIELSTRGYTTRRIVRELDVSEQTVWNTLRRYRQARNGL